MQQAVFVAEKNVLFLVLASDAPYAFARCPPAFTACCRPRAARWLWRKTRLLVTVACWTCKWQPTCSRNCRDK